MEQIEQSYLEMSQLLSSYHRSIQSLESDIKSSTKSRLLNPIPLPAFDFVSQAEINIKSREVERLKMLLSHGLEFSKYYKNNSTPEFDLFNYEDSEYDSDDEEDYSEEHSNLTPTENELSKELSLQK